MLLVITLQVAFYGEKKKRKRFVDGTEVHFCENGLKVIYEVDHTFCWSDQKKTKYENKKITDVKC